MGRILFISTPTRGHVNPMVGVAQWLMQAGHKVGWLCMPSGPDAVAAQLAASGIEAMGLPGVAPYRHGGGEELARIVRDPVAYEQRVRYQCVDNVDPFIEPTRQRIREFRANAIVLDGQIYAGVIASHLEAVPFASLCTTLLLAEPPSFVSDFGKIMARLSDDRAALFARHGIAAEFASVEYLSPWLNVMFATDALLGDSPLPARTYLVGPSIPSEQRGDEVAFPWDQLAADRPLVYASFGSLISWQPELFTKIAEAVAPLDVQLVLSAGDLTGTDFARALPGRTLCATYVPQMAMLERSAAFITHGGANSVMEAMYLGVPSLIVPMCRDQPLAGMFVEKAGAGLVIDPDALTVEACRAAVRVLIEEGGPHLRAAHRVRDSYRAQDGAKIAAEQIVHMMSSTEPARTRSWDR
jgi:MGT family glycosyltransferase